MTAFRDPWLDADVERFSIFVPAIMSAGLVFTILTLLRDVVHGRRRRHRARHVEIAAAVTASHVRTGEGASIVLGRVLRPRGAYVLTAATCVAVAVYVVVGASVDYGADGGRLGDIAWVLALSMVTAVLLLWLGVGAVLLMARREQPAPLATELLLSTPLGVAPETDAGSSGRRFYLGWATLVALGVFAATTTGVGGARRSFQAVDDRILDLVVGWEALDALRWADILGRTEVAVVAALVVGVATLRCLPFAAAYVSAVVVGLGATTLTRLIVERERPPGTTLTGGQDSFPSGHVVQAVLIAGLVPLAARVLTRRRWPAVLAVVVLAVAAALTAVLRVHHSLHWATDVLGGAALGATVVLGVRWSLEVPAWHARCHGCPWSDSPPPHRTLVQVSDEARRRIRAASLAVALLGIAAFGVLTATVGVPRDPEGTAMGETVEVAGTAVALTVLGIAWLASLRWPGAGAAGLAGGGLLLGALASVARHPAVSLLVAGLFGAPAVGLWLVWQHGKTRRVVSVLAAACALSSVALYAIAATVHDHFFGPAHPVSATASLPVDRVDWLWAGDVRTDGFEVVAAIHDGARTAALEVRQPGGPALHRTDPVALPEDGVVRLEVVGLEPGVRYRYAVVVDGVPDGSRGRGEARTAPAGAADLRIAVGACAQTGSSGRVFDAIRATEPDLYVITGDAHYGNPSEDDVSTFRSLLGRVAAAPAQAALYRQVPIAYVWDDHDYGPNDADSTSPTRRAARAAYRRFVPNGASPIGPIHQAFTVGRVRVVLTDTRSARTDDTMLGDAQREWLLDELRSASRTHAVVVWVNAVPWIAPADPGRDDWGGYAHERGTIVDAIRDAGIEDLVMVSGDAHMVALDDGTNSGGFPVLHAGALDRPGSVKGGPYSDGAFPGAGQFGVVDVRDDGGDVVEVTLSGRTWRGDVLVERAFEIDAR